MHLDKGQEKRFWSKVDKDGPIMPHMDTPCWVWTRKTNYRGYGIHSIKGRDVRAHRYIYEAEVSPIPDRLMVCHRCDNPSCVRPDHLFLGTNADNMIDASRKGRLPIKKLPSLDVLIQLRQSGLSFAAIGKQYNADRASVGYHFRKAGLIPPRKKRTTTKKLPPAEVLIGLRESGLTYRAIARMYDTYHRAVQDAIRKSKYLDN